MAPERSVRTLRAASVVSQNVGRTPACAHVSPQSALTRCEGRPDRAGPVPEGGRDDGGERAAVAPLDELAEGSPGGVEEQVAGAHQTATEHEALRVERGSQVGQAEADPAAHLLDHLA